MRKNRGICGFLCISWVLITLAMAPVLVGNRAAGHLPFIAVVCRLRAPVEGIDQDNTRNTFSYIIKTRFNAFFVHYQKHIFQHIFVHYQIFS